MDLFDALTLLGAKGYYIKDNFNIVSVKIVSFQFKENECKSLEVKSEDAEVIRVPVVEGQCDLLYFSKNSALKKAKELVDQKMTEIQTTRESLLSLLGDF